MRDFLMAGVVAATVGTLLAPLIARAAASVGFVDRPDAHHKRHRYPIPWGGACWCLSARSRV
jgi:UDP-N-acetylmuramyl pentapeptide phosphotransferase/UDP-N-acetylglucosamine-1-phosphate transferase